MRYWRSLDPARTKGHGKTGRPVGYPGRRCGVETTLVEWRQAQLLSASTGIPIERGVGGQPVLCCPDESGFGDRFEFTGGYAP